MKIVVTGASGFVGQFVVEFLKQANVELLLVGRDADKLKRIFPTDRVTLYENLGKDARGYDAIVHLAVLNNDSSAQISDFRAANVALLENVLNSARKAGIKTFINTTTLHAYSKKSNSSYAKTKKEGEELLSKADDIAVVTLRLPAVYGSTFKGKLAKLLKLPVFLRPVAMQILSSFKPTVNVKLVAAEILKSAQRGISIESIISDKQRGNLVYHIIRRVLNIAFALFVIILFWWVLLSAWIAVKLTSPGPGILAQKRVGKGGLLFTCYKFRTSHQVTNDASTHDFSSDNLTKVGRFLRKTKIDELPQVWNILKQELNLVGVHSCLPTQISLIEAKTALGILEEIGGITGWAQIQNVDTSDPDQIAKLDAEYLLLRSIPLDLKIIFATVIGRGNRGKLNLP